MTNSSESRGSPHTSDTNTLHNTRARIVGSRTGVLADSVVFAVRVLGIVRGAAGRWLGVAAAVVTPLGWGLLLATPVVLVLGYTLGWVEFVAVGWATIALAVVAVIYLIGRPRIQVELHLPHHRVVAGQPAELRVIARNPRGQRSLPNSVEIPVAQGLVELAIPGLRGNAEFSHEVPLPTTRRGVIPVGPVRTVRADPVGMVRRELVWSDEETLIVHPVTIAAPSTSTGLIHDLEGVTTRDLSSNDLAFHALREYQPGDERRYIHWKSTAKTGTYMVRQFEQTRRSHLAVALSLAPSDFANDDEFELAVSVTGSLGVRAIRDGRSLSVVVSTITPEFAKRPSYGVRALATHRAERLLDDLAVVDLADGAIGVRDVAHAVADQVGQVSLAFLVCGSTTTPAQLRSAASAFPVDVAVIAVICDPEALPGLRRVAGIDILSVGLLDDLKHALARTAATR